MNREDKKENKSSLAAISFPLTQVNIYDATAEQERDTHPGHNEAIPKMPQTGVRGSTQDVRVVQSVDEGRRKGSETCKDLAKTSDVEETSFRHGEELSQENQEGD